MLLVEKLRVAIDQSGIPVRQIALKINMSEQNLHRLFKKDSMETKYLQEICQIIEADICQFFEKKTDGRQFSFTEVNNKKGNLIAGDSNRINNRSSVSSSEQLRECQHSLETTSLKLQMAEKEIAFLNREILYLKNHHKDES